MKLKRTITPKTIILSMTAVLIMSSAAVNAKTKKFKPKLGVCTRITNNQLLADHGYQFIEEGVRKFLIPTKSDEEFAKNMEKLKASRLSVQACNSFWSCVV